MLIESRQLLLRMRTIPKYSMDFLILYPRNEKRLPVSWAQKHDFHKVEIFDSHINGYFYMAFFSRSLLDRLSTIKYFQEKRELKKL